MQTHGDLRVEIIENGPFVENCYIAMDHASGEAVVIDPGSEPDKIRSRAEAMEARIQRIANTHGHIDHVGGVAPLCRDLKIPFHMHPADQPWLDQLPTQAAMFGLGPVEIPEVHHPLVPGESIQIGALEATVLHTPGHTEGGCCFYFEREGVVFVGDTLFEGSIGRTDLPGGDHETLLAAIERELLSLDDAVVVYCGHGPPTLIGTERRHNPFLAR